jgi:hypothetical protein
MDTQPCVKLQCKDIPDGPILEFLAKQSLPCGWHDLNPRSDFMPTVRDAFPPDIPGRLLLAKMRMLIRRGLVDGCTCGCRGDFTIIRQDDP